MMFLGSFSTDTIDTKPFLGVLVEEEKTEVAHTTMPNSPNNVTGDLASLCRQNACHDFLSALASIRCRLVYLM